MLPEAVTLALLVVDVVGTLGLVVAAGVVVVAAFVVVVGA